jgi:CheY-like chemotaxis protein
VDLLRLAGERIALAVERAASREAERRARQAAEAASEAKDEFLALLSHELRSPLNAMSLWLQVLKTESASPEQVSQAVETLERSVWQQEQLIGDLLDVSRIVSGKLEVDLEHVDVAETVGACVSALQPTAEGKRVALRSDGIDGPSFVLGDGARLNQVVSNLVNNAIKFTPEGGRVEVRARRDGTNVRITVADTGQGITPDFLPHVFERFRQADSTTTRRHGGLGLGLAIARHLVEQHGGTIEVESPGEGKGSTFTVSLPLVPGARPAQAKPPARRDEEVPRGDDFSVLVVDDDVATCEALALAFKQRGAQVWIAHSVREALHVYDAASPDVVISDISMPEEDGYTLVRQIRERDAKRGISTVAVAMTGFAGRENRAKALAAGFEEHVAKPVDSNALIDTVRRLVRAAAH